MRLDCDYIAQGIKTPLAQVKVNDVPIVNVQLLATGNIGTPYVTEVCNKRYPILAMALESAIDSNPTGFLDHYKPLDRIKQVVHKVQSVLKQFNDEFWKMSEVEEKLNPRVVDDIFKEFEHWDNAERSKDTVSSILDSHPDIDGAEEVNIRFNTGSLDMKVTGLLLCEDGNKSLVYFDRDGIDELPPEDIDTGEKDFHRKFYSDVDIEVILPQMGFNIKTLKDSDKEAIKSNCMVVYSNCIEFPFEPADKEEVKGA